MSDIAAFMYVSVDPTAGGASFEVDGIFDDEPMCMHTTVPVSAHAWKNGSQYPSASWTDGKPRNGGISVNATARPPTRRVAPDLLAGELRVPELDDR